MVMRILFVTLHKIVHIDLWCPNEFYGDCYAAKAGENTGRDRYVYVILCDYKFDISFVFFSFFIGGSFIGATRN